MPTHFCALDSSALSHVVRIKPVHGRMCKCPSSSQKKDLDFSDFCSGLILNFVRCEFVLVVLFVHGPFPFQEVSMIRSRHLLKLSTMQKKTKDTTVNVSPSDLPPSILI